LESVTDAPGTAEPVASRTEPEIPPSPATCASAPAEQANVRRETATAFRIDFPLDSTLRKMIAKSRYSWVQIWYNLSKFRSTNRVQYLGRAAII
jgi:hypothetical protein